MKFIIILDTNIVHDDAENLNIIFGGNIKSLIFFIRENNITGKVGIVSPEVVIEERIHQRLEQVNAAKASIKNGIQMLSTLSKINSPDLNLEYETRLRDRVTQEALEYDIEIIRLPIIETQTVLKRALKKEPPFSKEKKSSDKGFKDTLIWLSIVDYIKNYQDKKTEFILICNDGSFITDLSEELNSICNKTIMIVKSIEEAKEILDNKLGLQLHLQSVNKQIVNEVKKEIGEFILYFNKIPLIHSTNFFFIEKSISALKFINMELIETKKIKEETYKVWIALYFNGFTQEDEKNQTSIFKSTVSTATTDLSYNPGTYSNFFSSMAENEMKNMKFILELEYNKKSNKIELTDYTLPKNLRQDVRLTFV